MRKIFLFNLLLFSIYSSGQFPGNYYVAAKNGLSLREKQDAGSKVLVIIPYGAKIIVAYTDETVKVEAGGMEGHWAKTSYGGKTGYVANIYLLPWAPPKATIQTMKQYLPQVSAVAGPPVAYKAGIMELEAGGSTMKKQLYKNGAEYHEEFFYESNNDIYFLPGYSLEQGFVLLRLIPEFKNIFGADETFPRESKQITRDGRKYDITVDTDKYFDAEMVNKIKVEYEDGAVYEFQMFILGGQLVISFGGGV